MNILFISETYIRENTPLNQNLDIKDIVNNIPSAQDMYIQPILGSNFYDYLLGVYSAQTLTSDEQTLVMLIKPALAYRSAEMSLPFVQYQIKNKGPQSQFGDNSNQVEMTQLSYLRNELKNRAEFYDTRLKKYLCDNGSKFPQYTTNNNVDILPEKGASGYDSGFATYPSYGLSNNVLLNWIYK